MHITCESVALVKRSLLPEQTCSPALSQKRTGKRAHLRPELREKSQKNMTIYASSLQKNRNKEVMTFSLFLVMTLWPAHTKTHQTKAEHPQILHTHKTTSPPHKQNLQSSIPPHLHPHHHSPCCSATLSRTKPSVRSPNSYATTTTTGTNLLQNHLFCKESWKAPTARTQSIETQDRQDQRPPCSWTIPPKESPSLCSLPHSTQWHLANVQEDWSVILDHQKDWPLCQCHRLEQTLANGAALYHPHPSFFCSIWWHCQWDPQQQLCHRCHVAWSLMFLRLPNCRWKHPQWNVLASDRHVHQGSD